MPRSFILGEHFETLIDEQVRSGLYADQNEVVRDALRLLEARDELCGHSVTEIREMVAEGDASGVSEEDGMVFLNRMIAEFDRSQAAAKAKSDH